MTTIQDVLDHERATRAAEQQERARLEDRQNAIYYKASAALLVELLNNILSITIPITSVFQLDASAAIILDHLLFTVPFPTGTIGHFPSQHDYVTVTLRCPQDHHLSTTQVDATRRIYCPRNLLEAAEQQARLAPTCHLCAKDHLTENLLDRWAQALAHLTLDQSFTLLACLYQAANPPIITAALDQYDVLTSPRS